MSSNSSMIRNRQQRSNPNLFAQKRVLRDSLFYGVDSFSPIGSIKILKQSVSLHLTCQNSINPLLSVTGNWLSKWLSLWPARLRLLFVWVFFFSALTIVLRQMPKAWVRLFWLTLRQTHAQRKNHRNFLCALSLRKVFL